MKSVKSTLESITQCMLLPGVELKFEDVVFYVKQGVVGVIRNGKKSNKI